MILGSLFGKRLTEWADMELVEAFRERKKEVYFDELFQRYHIIVFGLCLNLTANREDSKDLTLRIFSKASQAILSQELERFDHWLLSLARNECFTFLKLKKRRLAAREQWYKAQKTTAPFMENEAFRRQFHERELEKDKLLKEGWLMLSEDQQKCLHLFVYEWKSYREIASLTGLDLKQVKSQLQNGRRKLKTWVEGQLQSRNDSNK